MSPRHTAICQTHTAPAPEALTGRVHLPIAGALNAMAAFAGCSKAEIDKNSVSLADAPSLLQQALDQAAFRGETLHTLAVTGPGDPMASAEPLIETLAALHAAHPHLALHLRTNGLGAAHYAQSLAEAGVSEIFLDLDAVDPEIVRALFAWIRPGTKTLPRARAAGVLVEEQAATLAALRDAGIGVTLRTTLYPGINDVHIGELARRAAELGANAMLLVPWVRPEAETLACCRSEGLQDMEELFKDAPRSATGQDMAAARAAAAQHLPLCEDEDVAASSVAGICLGAASEAQGLTGLPKPAPDKPHVAVATSDGFEINMHLGQSQQFLIYGAPDGPPTLLESRPAPEAGSGDERWKALAAALSDCSYLLVAHAGANPEKVLKEQGLRLVRTEGNIESVVDHLYGGGKKKKCRK